MSKKINDFLMVHDPIVPWNYIYKLSRVGVGSRWRRGDCQASVVDLSNANPSTSELPLPFYAEFSFEWGDRDRGMKKRRELLSKAILYHFLSGGFEFDKDTYDRKPKIQALVSYFQENFLPTVPFNGCEIPEYVLDTWVEFASDELGF